MKTDSDSLSSARRTCLGVLISLLVLDAFAAGAEPAAKDRRAAKVKRAPVSVDESAEKSKADRKDPRLALVDLEAMRLAVQDLMQSFPDRYPQGAEYLKRLEEFEKRWPQIQAGTAVRAGAAQGELDKVLALQREALLANPLLDFEQLLVVRRAVKADEPPARKNKAKGNPDQVSVAEAKKARKPSESKQLGLPQNWQGNCALPKTGYDNDISVLSPLGPEGTLTPVFRPRDTCFVGDVRLHFDAGRVLFSMSSRSGPWQVYEAGLDGKGLRQVTPSDPLEADNYDACYLPDGRVIYTSTANMQGVPCVGGSSHVANLALLDPDTGQARMLAFEQDHDWCPTLMPNGRVMYSRWEYTDTPHYFTRLLFHANPDGTGQMEYYGSNSYWPNSLFYCKPIPGHPTQFVGIVSGHHGVPRMGELVLFDTALGRREADGVVQRIPGRGKKVEPVIADGLVNGSWPKFLHPWPLSDKYFLVSCKPSANALWGIYLAGVFDNLVLIKELPETVLFEPIPVRATPRPPVIPDKIDPRRDDATVYMIDVYRGPGLAGIPRGAVKQLRVFSYSYCYQGVGGHDKVGVESSWDVKRILGTVPVEADGSALFRVPANTPLAIQPLDGRGQALQLMRSWFTAMPGEVLSCVGCHESQNTPPANVNTIAASKAPTAIQPWYGPPRGFGFLQEVQPVLDQHCVACHDGQPRPDGITPANFADTRPQPVLGPKRPLQFPQSYLALHPFVVRPGPESDYHVLSPMDFHASASPLVQQLRKGHHNVQLDEQAWDRLVTWIDLNAPCYGSWREAYGGQESAEAQIDQQCESRTKNALLLASLELDPLMEKLAAPPKAGPPIVPHAEPPGKTVAPKVPGWPFSAADAQRRQDATGTETRRVVDLGGHVSLRMVLIPAGQFVMGDANGLPDEQPLSSVRIGQPFWMGVCEISNQQYARSDLRHDSGFIDQQGKDHNTPGYPANQPEQPVIRVSWQEAMEFCRWLSQRTGEPFTLPTEAEWEWACRAGTATPLWFGPVASDFAPFANLGDRMLMNFAVRGVNPKPITELTYLSFLPRVDQVVDGHMIAGPVGAYQPNPWGLVDMHGNVAEWTRTAYRPYPYDVRDGRDDPSASGTKAVRGGSWRDLPERARSAFRLSYEPYQRVFTVGFRVICPVAGN